MNFFFYKKKSHQSYVVRIPFASNAGSVAILVDCYVMGKLVKVFNRERVMKTPTLGISQKTVYSFHKFGFQHGYINVSVLKEYLEVRTYSVL